MEIYQIRQFVAVVETGSFTKGAARVAVSQPALSATIAKLEEEMGVSLLDRKRNAVSPTAAGKRLFSVGSSILKTCNTLKADIRAISSPRVLRIGVLRTLPTAPLASLLHSFMQEHPEVSVELYDGPADELGRRMLENKLDVTLSMIEKDANQAGCIALFTEPYVVLTSKGHRFASRTSISLEDLHDEPFIVRTSCETYESTTKILLSRGIRTRVVYKTDQDDRVMGLVAAGVGIALLPAIYCSDAVTARTISDFAGQRTIGIRWKLETVSEAQEAFVSFAQSHRWSVD